MSRDVKETLRETITQTHLMAYLQIRGYRCTQQKEAVAKELEARFSACSIEGMMLVTGLGRATVYRILKTFNKEGFVHFSPTLRGYFCCQKLYGEKAKSGCHSFGVCEKCGKVWEVIEQNHAHPKIQGFTHKSKEHEWLGLCTSCRLRA